MEERAGPDQARREQLPELEGGVGIGQPRGPEIQLLEHALDQRALNDLHPSRRVQVFGEARQQDRRKAVTLRESAPLLEIDEREHRRPGAPLVLLLHAFALLRPETIRQLLHQTVHPLLPSGVPRQGHHLLGAPGQRGGEGVSRIHGKGAAVRREHLVPLPFLLERNPLVRRPLDVVRVDLDRLVEQLPRLPVPVGARIEAPELVVTRRLLVRLSLRPGRRLDVLRLRLLLPVLRVEDVPLDDVHVAAPGGFPTAGLWPRTRGCFSYSTSRPSRSSG